MQSTIALIVSTAEAECVAPSTSPRDVLFLIELVKFIGHGTAPAKLYQLSPIERALELAVGLILKLDR